MTRSGIVLAGTAVLDIVNIVDHWPAEETLSRIITTEYAAGGPPQNAAAGLMKLGAPFPVTMVAVAGDDAYGDTMLASARAHGIDTSHVRRIPGAITCYTHVMSSVKTGKRTFFFHDGANALLDVGDLLPRATNAKLFYLGSPGVARKLDETDGWRKLFAAARKLGMKTCLELVPVAAEVIHDLVRPCLPLCDYIVANDYEVESITGLTVTKAEHLDWTAATHACKKLLELGVREMACVHHPDGGVAVSATGEIAMRASVNVPSGEILGSVGAGDAFYAGMLLGIHENWPLKKCLDLANASAATSLHSPTTSASIRPWRECLKYAESHGLRVPV